MEGTTAAPKLLEAADAAPEGLVRSSQCTRSATATPESDGKCHRHTKVPPKCRKLTERAAATPEVAERCHQITKVVVRSHQHPGNRQKCR